MDKIHLSSLIRAEALDVGFSACGITRPAFLSEQARWFKQWMHEGCHAGMKYLETRISSRENILEWMPRTRSVIMVLLNYYPQKKQKTHIFRVAKYAYGKDYHGVIRYKLNQLTERIRRYIPFNGQPFVDTSPVFEKHYAQQAGLGWIGRNTLLIHPVYGSFVLIGGLATDIELDYDKPYSGPGCGVCRLCIRRCPTNALTSGYVLDARRCISYLNKDTDDNSGIDFHSYVFGCDICQDVCPFNSHCLPHREPEFFPHPAFPVMTDDEWRTLSQAGFSQLFSHTPLGRMPFRRLKRNIEACDSCSLT